MYVPSFHAIGDECVISAALMSNICISAIKDESIFLRAHVQHKILATIKMRALNFAQSLVIPLSICLASLRYRLTRIIGHHPLSHSSICLKLSLCILFWNVSSCWYCSKLKLSARGNNSVLGGCMERGTVSHGFPLWFHCWLCRLDFLVCAAYFYKTLVYFFQTLVITSYFLILADSAFLFCESAS